MKAEVFLGALSIGSAPFSRGLAESNQINADAIDVDVGPYVANTIHKKYRLFSAKQTGK